MQTEKRTTVGIWEPLRQRFAYKSLAEYKSPASKDGGSFSSISLRYVDTPQKTRLAKLDGTSAIPFRRVRPLGSSGAIKRGMELDTLQGEDGSGRDVYRKPAALSPPTIEVRDTKHSEGQFRWFHSDYHARKKFLILRHHEYIQHRARFRCGK